MNGAVEGASWRELLRLDVSRETELRLERYEALLLKWNARINLVSRADLSDLRRRHFADSAQLLSLACDGAAHWVDFGAGGGFPGLVIAILAAEIMPGMRMTLVESDRRKAAFLATAARELCLDIRLIADRIENLEPLDADIVSARALAPLDKLLSFAQVHMKPGGTAVFPKGARAEEEISMASESWSFSCTRVASATDPQAVILSIKEIRRA